MRLSTHRGARSGSRVMLAVRQASCLWAAEVQRSPAGPQSAGIRQAVRGPGLVSREQWNAVISGASREVWLYGMAEYSYATDDEVPVMLKRATARGCLVRVLLLMYEEGGAFARHHLVDA